MSGTNLQISMRNAKDFTIFPPHTCNKNEFDEVQRCHMVQYNHHSIIIGQVTRFLFILYIRILSGYLPRTNKVTGHSQNSSVK